MNQMSELIAAFNYRFIIEIHRIITALYSNIIISLVSFLLKSRMTQLKVSSAVQSV